VPWTLVQHGCDGQPWRVESVTGNGALLGDLAGERVRVPLTVLQPGDLESRTQAAGGGR